MSATEVLSALDRIHGTVSVIGSMNADYTVTAQRLPGPGETITGGPLQLLPGGKSGNQAAAAARIGATVQMFGAVGSDSNADFLLGALGEGGREHHACSPRARTIRHNRDYRGRNRRKHHRVLDRDRTRRSPWIMWNPCAMRWHGLPYLACAWKARSKR